MKYASTPFAWDSWTHKQRVEVLAYDRLEAETALKRNENKAANQAGPAAQRALVQRRLRAMGGN